MSAPSAAQVRTSDPTVTPSSWPRSIAATSERETPARDEMSSWRRSWWIRSARNSRPKRSASITPW